MNSKLTKARQSKAQITPTSCPSEKIHGGGWAGCGKGASNHGCQRSTRSSPYLYFVFVFVFALVFALVFAFVFAFVFVFVFAL